jgi:DNA-binding transcriptional LysR family regulator
MLAWPLVASLVPLACCGVAAILALFLAKNPQSRIALHATNRRVDEGLIIDMRVRKPPLEDSDLVMRVFGPDEMILVASAELIAAHGKPQTLEDIGRMPTLSMANAGERSTWLFLGTDGEPAGLTHSPRLCTDDLFTLRRAALPLSRDASSRTI